MQPEDSQIDVLLKRYGREAGSGALSAEHLDADELNAFAEGAVPASARSRYVSHLADCGDCRRVATQLSIAAGSTVSAGAGAIETAGGSLWQKVTSFFAPPMLRYGAFAAVLVVAVGVTFLALRNQRGSAPLLAQHEQANETQAGAVKQGEAGAPPAQQKVQDSANPSATITVLPLSPSVDLKKDESKIADDSIARPKPEKDSVASADQPMLAGKRAAAPVSVEQQRPLFAPPPPGEAGRAQAKSGDDRDAQRVASVSGPRKSEPAYDKLKEMDRVAGGSQTRGAEGADNRARNDQAMNQQSPNQQSQQNQQSQNRMLDSNSNATTQGSLAVNRARGEENTETGKKPATSAARRESESAPETRSAGGHKFRRQGNAWVDSKFKSSMSITNVARGSDAFRALDSALRSMAEQLGGEVLVVSKGKAYRIR